MSEFSRTQVNTRIALDRTGRLTATTTSIVKSIVKKQTVRVKVFVATV